MEKKIENIHILIPIWGEKYISTFMNTAMIALLAPGNIPYCSKQCNITVVFLTTKKSMDIIQKFESFSLLSNFCHIEYEAIDDLIAEGTDYTIPLTLAYVRGVTRIGSAMTETFFIFYNADFILSNNGLTSIINLIRKKNDIILATSFRADEGKISHKIRKIIQSESGEITSRTLSSLSLESKHHTVISRTANQKKYTNIHWNQVYWEIDNQTILARYFLTTLFCFRPSQFRKSINSFIDYSILDVFCPDGKITAIEDSDDFFLLEMQPSQQELYFLKIGSPDIRKIADSVSSWTTRRHRLQARYETVIHGGDLPHDLENGRQRFHAFMDEVEKHLPRHVLQPETHHHWVGALRLWMPRKMRYDAMQEQPQPFTGLDMPLVRIDASMEKKTRGRLAQIIAFFLGIPPKAFPWHPLWGNYRAIRKAMHENLLPNETLLFITDSFTYDGLVMEHDNVTKVFAADALNGHLDKICPDKKFSACLIAVECDNLDIKRFIKNIAAYMDEAQTIMVFFGRTMTKLSKRNKHFMGVYHHALTDMRKYNPRICHIGNWWGLTLTKWMLDAIHRIKLNPVWHIPQMLAVSCACLINNLYCAFLARERSTPGVTGVLAVFSLHGERA